MTVLVDARGLRCPWPALRLARAMRDHDAVSILADDPQAGREIDALAQAHGWRTQPFAGGVAVSKPHP
jgi:tRNA 2-thiouridine synthesizing protein A